MKISFLKIGWKIGYKQCWGYLFPSDSNPGFLMNTDLDPDFADKKLRKKTLWKGNKNLSFTSEIAINFFFGLHEGLLS
jgi:hypothetical protein